MQTQESINDKLQAVDYPTTYRELKAGNTVYRVTGIYKGEIDLKHALEDLTVRKAARTSVVCTK